MNALLGRIETGEAFEKHYLGAQPIFNCLKNLNDLVRLSQALGTDFPFPAYAAIENIPVIEVEFVHLAGLDAHLGQLTPAGYPRAERGRGSRICKKCSPSSSPARRRCWR
ncbi:Uncharacterised protein [Leclercia adecarboxylata]|uniref:Uncharacterized protein n=1 Tax=Leclercia adecarboxylata TaxID=83655 RepID=A0A4U9HHQ8_9ENTR|nr:Uncharacterised protein [Leclercia adecarboxylata]